MTQQDKPVGEMELIGRVAYQIYSRNFRGNVEFYARIGKPFTNKQTGVTSIIPHMMDDSTRDHLEAAERAAADLEQLRKAEFRHNVHKNASAISPIEEADGADEPLVLKLA